MPLNVLRIMLNCPKAQKQLVNNQVDGEDPKDGLLFSINIFDRQNSKTGLVYLLAGAELWGYVGGLLCPTTCPQFLNNFFVSLLTKIKNSSIQAAFKTYSNVFLLHVSHDKGHI